MELDYIDHINAYGDNIVRLYNFDKSQAMLFCNILHQNLIVDQKELELCKLDFIQARNCSLVLRISATDEGITSSDNQSFFCDMTKEGYKQMLILLEPFCLKETKAYQLLYDIDSLTDFLFSPNGSW
jgi:hypothetical protein